MIEGKIIQEIEAGDQAILILDNGEEIKIEKTMLSKIVEDRGLILGCNIAFNEEEKQIYFEEK